MSYHLLITMKYERMESMEEVTAYMSYKALFPYVYRTRQFHTGPATLNFGAVNNGALSG